MIGCISTSVTSSLSHTYYSTIVDLHNLQFTVAHGLGLSIFTSHLLAMDLNREISTSVTSSLSHTYYSTIVDLHNLEFTVAHALGLSIFTSHLLAMDLNRKISTSNHYEVFLSFLVQSPWNLELN
jgi:redox-regulated HSP33 family molecular chaperone